MNLYLTSFCSAARKLLDALAGFDPPWSLSGRAALWWRTAEAGPIRQVSLVWHDRDGLDTLPLDIHARLAAAGLDPATLHRGRPRWLWLAVQDGESGCALKLAAEPGAALARPWQVELHGHFIYVESWRDTLVTTLCSLYERPTPEDLGDLYLLVRRGASLEQGLLDVLRRNRSFDPQRLAWTVASFEVFENDTPMPLNLAEFRRFRQELGVRIRTWAHSL